MNKKTIINFIKGKLSEREEAEVIQWLLKNPEQRKDYEILKAKYVAASLKDKDLGFKRSNNTKKRFARLYKYAAIFLVLFSTAIFTVRTINNKEDVTEETSLVLITTERGERKEVYLSDSTKVILNANSILSYNNTFEGDTREVILKGEAYFDVTENKEKPFIVKTDNGLKVKVLGTAFNVRSYAEDDKVETTLVRGKVRVIEEKDNKVVELQPSQKATFVKSEEKIIVEKVNPENFTSWKEGKLIYNNAPMRQVLSDIKRTFNVEFEVKSPAIYDYKYKGTFDNLNLEQTLELFELSSPIKITKIKNRIVLETKK